MIAWLYGRYQGDSTQSVFKNCIKVKIEAFEGLKHLKLICISSFIHSIT